MKIISMLVLLLALAIPLFAQDATPETETKYTSFFDVIRFDSPAGWEISEKDPYSKMLTYTRPDLTRGDMNIEINIQGLDESLWHDFNLPLTTDFETWIEKAVRWRWKDYTVVTLGNRQYVHHAEDKAGKTFSYWVTFLDTGMLATILAVSPPDQIDEITPTAEQIATSLEYVGDSPVDLTCVPLDHSTTLLVNGGSVSFLGESGWTASHWDNAGVAPNEFAFRIRKDDQIKGTNRESDCFGVPYATFDLLLFHDTDFSLNDLEQTRVQDLTQQKTPFSIEHLIIHNQPALMISSEYPPTRIVSQEYIGLLPDGYRFHLLFKALPGQTERWQGVALQMAESITFKSTE